MKKYTFFIMGILLPLLKISAQPASGLPNIPPGGITVGQPCPDVTIGNIIHYPESQVKISDFRGKLLILDFWATWCSPCIAMLPKADSLEKRFKGKVLFLPVAYQNRETVEPFLDRIRLQKGMEFPSVTGDKLLSKLFPHIYLPHYVWIDDAGIVRAITGLEEITRENIRSVLQDSSFRLPVKKDRHIAYDKSKPLFINGNGGDGKELIYRSLLSGYAEGLSGGYTIFPREKGGKILTTNEALIWMFQVAYGEGKQYFPRNQIYLAVKDSSRFLTKTTGREYEKWARKNAYCYELIVPPFLYDQRYKIMQQDLDRLFPRIRVTVENRKTKCLVLVRTSAEDHLASRGGTPTASFNILGCTMRNKYLIRFFMELKVKYMQSAPLPLINETGYRGRVDLSIKANLSDVGSVNAALKKYGLRFVEDYRPVPFMVIRDRPAKE